MAEPIANILSTPTATYRPSEYSYFEPNQVLDSKQLNTLAEHLNHQEHLARVKLLGVGIVGGLQVSSTGSSVTVRHGVGVTTDGDVLTMPVDTVYSRFRDYGPAAPPYEPFGVGDTTNPILELVLGDLVDGTIKPLSSLPNLAEMVVVMLMERSLDDPDVCSGTDCDNLGKTVIETVRVLLVTRERADLLLSLLSVLGTVASAAQSLPELLVDRPLITGKITTTQALGDLYRMSCAVTHNSLVAELPKLFVKFADFVRSVLKIDADPVWVSRLTTIKNESANRDVGIQYYYSFLKDVVDTWNELRETLLDDDSVLCPDVAAFPKHLVLGDLADWANHRTGLYPSPLVSGSGVKSAHARCLLDKLHALIMTFKLPAVVLPSIRVTPSRSEVASLEDRAIPYYYAVGGEQPRIELHWNFRLSKRGAATSNLGYHAESYGGTKVARNRLKTQIGRYDFFRVEGHLGHDVTKAKRRIEELIRTHNLPFVVRAVLLDVDRKKIVIKPPIRYSDLHRFHYVLRNDVATHLAESAVFSASVAADVKLAVEKNSIPTSTHNGATHDDLKLVNDATTSFELTSDKLLGKSRTSGPLTDSGYSKFVGLDGGWKQKLEDTVVQAGLARSKLGHLLRADLASPVDSIFTTKHHVWLDWIELLNKQREDDEDDRLLFHNFWEEHPGLEHFGGVSRGGTLVLVYDANATVVADFMLPYAVPEPDQREPVEPTLPPPLIRLPTDVKPIKVITPIDMEFRHFEDRIKPKWRDQLDLQTQFLDQQIKVQQGYFGVIKDSVDLVSKANVRQVLQGDIKNQRLKAFLSGVKHTQGMVEDLRGLIIDPATPDPIREELQVELKKAELELAGSIVESATFLIRLQIEFEAGSDGSKAIAVLSQGLDKVADKTAMTKLKAFALTGATGPLKQLLNLRGL